MFHPRNKKVSFNDDVYVREISRPRWDSNDRSQLWYDSHELNQFTLDEYMDRITGPKSQELEHIERMTRIREIRCLVLRAHYAQKAYKKPSPLTNTNNNNNDDADDTDDRYWLASFSQKYSEEARAAARHRGIENDLWVLDFKLQEVNSMLSKESEFSLDPPYECKSYNNSGTNDYTNASSAMSDINNATHCEEDRQWLDVGADTFGYSRNKQRWCPLGCKSPSSKKIDSPLRLPLQYPMTPPL